MLFLSPKISKNDKKKKIIISASSRQMCHCSQLTFSERHCEKTSSNYLYSYTPDQASIQTKGLEPSPCVSIQLRHQINYSVAVKAKKN